MSGSALCMKARRREFKICALAPAVTKYPMPRRLYIMPSRASVSYALTAVLVFTSIATAYSRTLGTLSSSP